jgi:uncharacterized membrane protein
MEHILISIFTYVVFFAGFIGILVISIGIVKALYFFFRNKSFWQIRVLLVKHILLGLDFLIARDIIETVILKSNTALWIDLAALVLIIIIRVVFSHFAEKEMDQLLEDHKEKIQVKLK